MKFFQIISRNNHSINDLLAAYFELEQKEKETQNDLSEAKSKTIELQRQRLEGKGDREKLKDEQIQALDLQGRLDALHQMKAELFDKMLVTARRDWENKMFSLDLKVKKTREKENEFNLELLLARATVSVLSWLINGVKIEVPSHVTASQRTLFFNEIDRLKKEFGVKQDTKPIQAERMAIFDEMKMARSKIIDQKYVEDLIQGLANLG